MPWFLVAVGVAVLLCLLGIVLTIWENRR